MAVPKEQRAFAVEVVRRLRQAGFEAYWAGGCVRDLLLQRVAKDYDVATNATPEQIRRLFGRGRTLAIGAAFGVITVLGSKAAGMVEVGNDSSVTDPKPYKRPKIKREDVKVSVDKAFSRAGLGA